MFGIGSMLAQAYPGNSGSGVAAGGGIVGAMVALVELALLVVALVGAWKTFVKAGWPGWAAIVPIYNAYAILKIAGKPGWWLLLLLIPIVNLVIVIIVFIAFAERFGKGVGFGFGLAFLGFIFFPILGFGDAVYQSLDSSRRGFPVGQTTPIV